MLQNNGLDYPSLEKEHEEYLSQLVKTVKKEMNPPTWKPMVISND